MTQPFFITGLPCSRTAWLANLFTTGPVFCHHDLLAEVKDLDEFADRMMTPGAGDSDSGLLACYSQVIGAFPHWPWLLVVRDFDDSWQSLCNFAQSGPWRDQLPLTWEAQQSQRALWEKVRPLMLEDPRVLTVQFGELENTNTLERIWRHLVPCVRFDRRRAEALQKLRVQPMQSKCNIKPALSLVKELWHSSPA